MDNKSALQLEVEKEMGFEIDEDLFAYLEHYARRKLEVAFLVLGPGELDTRKRGNLPSGHKRQTEARVSVGP